MNKGIRVEHELHRRRLSRNVGLGVVLLLFVGLVYAITVVKVSEIPNAIPHGEASK